MRDDMWTVVIAIVIVVAILCSILVFVIAREHIAARRRLDENAPDLPVPDAPSPSLAPAFADSTDIVPAAAPTSAPSPAASFPAASSPSRLAAAHPAAVAALPVFRTRRYPVLRFISACLRILGWLLIVLSVLGLLLILFIIAVAFSQDSPLLSGFAVPFIAPAVFAGLLGGLLTVAAGELIQLFVDMAADTRHLLEVVRHAADLKSGAD